jgi:hypothetical protein
MLEMPIGLTTWSTISSVWFGLGEAQPERIFIFMAIGAARSAHIFRGIGTVFSNITT